MKFKLVLFLALLIAFVGVAATQPATAGAVVSTFVVTKEATPEVTSSPEAAVPGPAIPKNTDGSGYTQQYIACNTAVFDAPGGNAINGASVKEGQVFYAGKDTKEDADGKSWTPIFVSSNTPVWILTSCVK